MSRFSKIAGEMVPHETIEANIAEAFCMKAEEERVLAIIGVPDHAKGESLVLLATMDLSRDKIRKHLLESGMPSLWVPRTVRRVDQIPILGSGKLDIAKCKELALTRKKHAR